MGEDLSTGAKIGIILIILCSLIAIVFSLLTMMKNITNSGSSQLQSSLDQMLISKFDDYNQTTVSGNAVTAAIKVFEGNDVAIVVRPNIATKETAKDFKALGGYNYGANLCGYGGATMGGSAFTPIELKGYGDVYLSTNTIDLDGSSACPIYDDSFNFDTNGLALHKSKTYYVGQLAVKEGDVLVSTNPNSRPLNASGRPTYVRSNAKYRAMLIKDSGGGIIGVCFDELVTS